ncbi:AEC family transporter [Leptospira sp. GIMC2001]|uniref:AEC family transporter n=1 Tax=Leptospira sp. GIMC2001 TaxID=1513297 RepID=UPI0023493211|nr:AEC family transporter [Leptospira sp. GIMC2001]WCL48769.1 AEC family transporter [Leptospira sp. GIMC2001]
MSNLALLLICFVLGIILRKSSRFPEGSFRILNGFIINISLPSLILFHIRRMNMEMDLIWAALMPWIIFILAILIFGFFYYLQWIDSRTAGCLMLTAGLGNTSFVGLPLIEAYYGTELLGVGIIADQFGSFLALGTIGILVATIAKTGTFDLKKMGAMIIGFPPSIALIFAFISLPLEYPNWLESVLERLGDSLTPLALVSVGMQINLRETSGRIVPLSFGLFYKLIACPIIIYLIYYKWLRLDGKVIDISIFEAGMAPMVTGTIVAMENDLNPELATLMLGIGIPISFITTYAIFTFI